MFRRLIVAIFRLYMNHLISSYTIIYIYIYICLYNCLLIHVQPEDGHHQAPKHIVALYVTILYIYIYIYIYIHRIVVLDSKFTPLEFTSDFQIGKCNVDGSLRTDLVSRET